MGMRPSVGFRGPKRLYVVLRQTASQACAAASVWAWALMIALLVMILPWQTVAETTSPAPTYPPEASPGSLRQGIVTLISNLRASPSINSEILAVAKEGTRVKILLESGRWLQVRSEEGVEAWIYKPLVLIEQEPSQSSSETPGVVEPSHLPKPVPAAPATPEVLVESPPENTLEEPEAEASLASLVKELLVLTQMRWTAWISAISHSTHQGLASYIIIALTIVLVLSIALQLRAARQLRWAVQEVGQLLDIVEEIYTGGMMGRRSDSAAIGEPVTGAALAGKSAPPGIEFSPTEDIVLKALSDRPEVQEAELGKLLAEKGYTGVLIKAIIGDIVRKTGTLGLPWVDVSYVQGRYCYRLRSDAVPKPSIPRVERG